MGRGRFVLFGAISYSALALSFLAAFIRLFEVQSSVSINMLVAAILVAYGPIWSHSFWVAMEEKWR